MAWVRRALLIQTIAIGIERIEAADPLVSRDPTMNAVDQSTPLITKSTGHVVLSRFGNADNSSTADVAAIATSQPMPLSGGWWLTCIGSRLRSREDRTQQDWGRLLRGLDSYVLQP